MPPPKPPPKPPPMPPPMPPPPKSPPISVSSTGGNRNSTSNDGNSNAGNPRDSNPGASNPGDSNPDSTNPDAGNPGDSNPDSTNPDSTNPDAGNPDDSNPDSIPDPIPDDGNPNDGINVCTNVASCGDDGRVYLSQHAVGDIAPEPPFDREEFRPNGCFATELIGLAVSDTIGAMRQAGITSPALTERDMADLLADLGDRSSGTPAINPDGSVNRWPEVIEKTMSKVVQKCGRQCNNLSVTADSQRYNTQRHRDNTGDSEPLSALRGTTLPAGTMIHTAAVPGNSRGLRYPHALRVTKDTPIMGRDIIPPYTLLHNPYKRPGKEGEMEEYNPEHRTITDVIVSGITVAQREPLRLRLLRRISLLYHRLTGRAQAAML